MCPVRRSVSLDLERKAPKKFTMGTTALIGATHPLARAIKLPVATRCWVGQEGSSLSLLSKSPAQVAP